MLKWIQNDRGLRGISHPTYLFPKLNYYIAWINHKLAYDIRESEDKNHYLVCKHYHVKGKPKETNYFGSRYEYNSCKLLGETNDLEKAKLIIYLNYQNFVLNNCKRKYNGK